MAIGNVELVHKCFPKYSRLGTARMKYNTETDKEGEKRGVSMKRSKAGTKEKISTDGLNYSNQNTIIINTNYWYFIRDGKSTMKLN